MTFAIESLYLEETLSVSQGTGHYSIPPKNTKNQILEIDFRTYEFLKLLHNCLPGALTLVWENSEKL